MITACLREYFIACSCRLILKTDTLVHRILVDDSPYSEQDRNRNQAKRPLSNSPAVSLYPPTDGVDIPPSETATDVIDELLKLNELRQSMRINPNIMQRQVSYLILCSH
jgi:hypothetical protein